MKELRFRSRWYRCIHLVRPVLDEPFLMCSTTMSRQRRAKTTTTSIGPAIHSSLRRHSFGSGREKMSVALSCPFMPPEPRRNRPYCDWRHRGAINDESLHRLELVHCLAVGPSAAMHASLSSTQMSTERTQRVGMKPPADGVADYLRQD